MKSTQTKAPHMFGLLPLAIAATLTACGGDGAAPEDDTSDRGMEVSVAMEVDTGSDDGAAPAPMTMDAVLAMQSEEAKARFDARHPAETLGFFGIEPGMTVVEMDPSGGWYSKILSPWLGAEGTLIGVDLDLTLYPLFNYYSEEELAAKATWASRWPAEVAGWGEEAGYASPAVAAYNLGAIPPTVTGTADAVLIIRVLHNLADYEEEGAYLTNAIADTWRVLKPGGVVGVVQHMGPETHSDAWAEGGYGYLKKSAVISGFEDAGFVLDGDSAVNENPADIPTEEESVWRLPPTSEEVDDPELAAAYLAIGESNRMTLRFKKPE